MVDRSEMQKMLAGDLYRPSDPEIQSALLESANWIGVYNSASPADRYRLLKARFGSIGERSEIRAPFFCDYGFNIHLGTGVFLNFNCVILDVVEVRIGDGTQIGPAVQIYAADHPRDLQARKAGLEFGRPVTIGRNVWIGGGALIMPGVTIGDDAIIGAGSVVTKDIPSGATAKGNPAR